MFAQLSEEQRQALQAGTPVEIRDGDHTFYLISKTEYEMARAALEAEEIEPSFFEFDDDEDPHPSTSRRDRGVSASSSGDYAPTIGWTTGLSSESAEAADRRRRGHYWLNGVELTPVATVRVFNNC
jgi:hypothetical protein